jgi:hypothetical protein
MDPEVTSTTPLLGLGIDDLPVWGLLIALILGRWVWFLGSSWSTLWRFGCCLNGGWQIAVHDFGFGQIGTLGMALFGMFERSWRIGASVTTQNTGDKPSTSSIEVGGNIDMDGFGEPFKSTPRRNIDPDEAKEIQERISGLNRQATYQAVFFEELSKLLENGGKDE